MDEITSSYISNPINLI